MYFQLFELRKRERFFNGQVLNVDFFQLFVQNKSQRGQRFIELLQRPIAKSHKRLEGGMRIYQ